MKTELDAIKAAASPGAKLMLVDRDDMPFPPKIFTTRDLVGTWSTPRTIGSGRSEFRQANTSISSAREAGVRSSEH